MHLVLPRLGMDFPAEMMWAARTGVGCRMGWVIISRLASLGQVS